MHYRLIPDFCCEFNFKTADVHNINKMFAFVNLCLAAMVISSKELEQPGCYTPWLYGLLNLR